MNTRKIDRMFDKTLVQLNKPEWFEFIGEKYEYEIIKNKQKSIMKLIEEFIYRFGTSDEYSLFLIGKRIERVLYGVY